MQDPQQTPQITPQVSQQQQQQQQPQTQTNPIPMSNAALPPGAIVVNPQFIPKFYPNLVQGKKQISRHKFSQDEDDLLRKLVNEHGATNWRFIAENIPGRSARQCRDRWKNYLMPGISNAPWTPEEDQLLEQKYAEMGSQWSRIAKFFPSRTDINIKNRWATRSGRVNRAQPIGINNINTITGISNTINAINNLSSINGLSTININSLNANISSLAAVQQNSLNHQQNPQLNQQINEQQQQTQIQPVPPSQTEGEASTVEISSRTEQNHQENNSNIVSSVTTEVEQQNIEGKAEEGNAIIMNPEEVTKTTDEQIQNFQTSEEIPNSILHVQDSVPAENGNGSSILVADEQHQNEDVVNAEQNLDVVNAEQNVEGSEV
ncbi:hypothetical protein TRFO_38024 [Tritrichomonas foetus]|uniref:Myb-like DNA-binding domain containing protein n=1 Tax=Tritrichomonas foetus TaxID=1144522 RepID=A0A1J4JEF8_9EUKA|nr:hypothetical protein TRFO_38024 [Tritrichomonas foetus]|eukprot:OHS95821.1 hypothetical protein TRFO_38024 [Tritrichomonas foetus]